MELSLGNTIAILTITLLLTGLYTWLATALILLKFQSYCRFILVLTVVGLLGQYLQLGTMLGEILLYDELRDKSVTRAEWTFFYFTCQLQWLSTVLLTLSFMIFYCKVLTQKRLARLHDEAKRARTLKATTLGMGALCTCYLLLQLLRSYLTYLLFEERPSSLVLFSLTVCVQGLCLALDVTTVGLFYFLFRRVNRLQKSSGQQKTCWDVWARCVIMYLIVAANLIVALYRCVWQVGLVSWYQFAQHATVSYADLVWGKPELLSASVVTWQWMFVFINFG